MHGSARAMDDRARRNSRGDPAGGARRREDGRRAADLVELRLELEGSHRCRQRALARPGLPARARRDRVHPPALTTSPPPPAARRRLGAIWLRPLAPAALAPCAETSMVTSPPPPAARRRLGAIWLRPLAPAALAPCAETSMVTSPPPPAARRRDRCFPR